MICRSSSAVLHPPHEHSRSLQRRADATPAVRAPAPSGVSYGAAAGAVRPCLVDRGTDRFVPTRRYVPLAPPGRKMVGDRGCDTNRSKGINPISRAVHASACESGAFGWITGGDVPARGDHQAGRERSELRAGRSVAAHSKRLPVPASLDLSSCTPPRPPSFADVHWYLSPPAGKASAPAQ